MKLNITPKRKWVLAASCGLLLIVLWPKTNNRKELRRVLEMAATDPGQYLRNNANRRTLLKLLKALQNDGDERGLRLATETLLKAPELSKEELDEIAGPALHDLWFWNTEIPSWKQALIHRWMAANQLLETPQWRTSQTAAPATFHFQTTTDLPNLFLQGNWNQKGELSDIGGWEATPFKRGAAGRSWSTRVMLRRTRQYHSYHAVVRTAPWPEGQALGAVDFEIHGSTEISIHPTRIPPAAPLAKTTDRDHPAMEVSLLGLDGATWHLILPWVYQGRLPHFERLWREGSVATLTSSTQEPGRYPSVPNIYSAMTGKLMPRHNVGAGMADGTFNTNLSRISNPLWKIFSDFDRRSAAISMWASFPPDPIKGIMATEVFFALEGMKAIDVAKLAKNSLLLGFAREFGIGEDFITRILKTLRFIGLCFDNTHPPSLARELRPKLSGSGNASLDGLTTLLDGYVAQTVSAAVQNQTFHLLCAYLMSIDAVSHLYLGEAEPYLLTKSAIKDHPAERLFETYQKADELIGRLMDRSRYFILWSDHGFGVLPVPKILLVDMDRFMMILQKELPVPIKYKMDEWITGQKERTFWLQEPRDTKFAQNLETLFKNAVFLPGRQSVFKHVTRKRSGPEGVHFELEPAAAPQEITGIHLGDSPYQSSDFIGTLDRQIRHLGNGIVAMTGPGIKAGKMLEPAYITDIAPTALYIANLPLASDMDGELLRDIFEEPYLKNRPIKIVSSHGSGGSGVVRLLKAIRWRALGRQLNPSARVKTKT